MGEVQLFSKHYIQLNKLTFTAALQMGESKLAGVGFTAGRGMCCLHVRFKPDTSSHCSHTTATPGNTAGPVLSLELSSSDIPPQTCGRDGFCKDCPYRVGSALPGVRDKRSSFCAGMTVPFLFFLLDLVPTPPVLPPRNILMALPSSETKEVSSLPENSRVAEVNKLSLSETLLQRLQYQDTSR